MSYERLERLITGSNIPVHSTKALDHFLHVQLDNCDVLIIQMDKKYAVPYVAVYIYSKDNQYAGKFPTPELNLLTELRRLSELDRDDVVKCVIANTEV